MAKRNFLDGYKTYDVSGGYGNASQWRQSFKKRMTNDEAKEVLQSAEKTPLQVLGLDQTATAAEIKKAFRRLITEWHPDKNQHRIREAEEMSKRIIAAYTILKN
jgi:DnaJ-domain-containing protein 1